MNSKSMILLRAMFKSTSRINTLKYSTDKKKRRQIKAGIFGMIVLMIYGAALAGGIAAAMAANGLAETVPLMVATIITIMSLVFTILKSNGFLYGFKEYDMIMAMPFSVNTIVSDRFLFMYLRDLRWDALVSISALVGYAIVTKPPVIVYVLWILLTPFISLLPTVVSSLLGVLVARIGSRSKHRNVIQTVLIYIFVIPLFFIQYVINYIMGTNQVESVLNQSSAMLGSFSRVVPTVAWFGKAVNSQDILSVILLIVVSLVIYVGAIVLIGKSYRRINSNLASFNEKKKNKAVEKSFKKRNVMQSIAYKEFKKITGSTTCATNICLGAVMSILVGLVLLFVDVNTVVKLFTQGHEVDVTPYRLIWPFFVYFFIGMVPATAPSLSLEGKNYWIIKTMPVDMMTVIKGKMLFNIYLCLPTAMFAVVSGCRAMKGGPLDYLLSIYIITVLIVFSTVYGMRCGAKHMRLDWENEVEVVKNGPAVNTYTLPNLFGTMILIGALIGLSHVMDIRLLVLIVSVIYILLTIWSYTAVKRFSRIV
ncbi:MAG: hypothetical protein J5509_09355 [Lachnospiraceae bacterium]|nr:hypothetical protein [Lachnospiraceae bacterium]